MTLSTTEFIELRKQMVDNKKIFEYLPFKTKATLKKWCERIRNEFENDQDTLMTIVQYLDSKTVVYHKDNFPMYVAFLATRDVQDKIRGKKKCEN